MVKRILDIVEEYDANHALMRPGELLWLAMDKQEQNRLPGDFLKRAGLETDNPISHKVQKFVSCFSDEPEPARWGDSVK